MGNTQIVSIFGGSGFLGGHITQILVKAGYMVNVATRSPARCAHYKLLADPGRVCITEVDFLQKDSIRKAIQGTHIVINLIGIFHETRYARFSAVHAQQAETIAKLSHEEKVSMLIHVSALGVDHCPASRYARSKLDGEKAVRASFPNATILRPGAVFGKTDQFINLFAKLLSLIPVMPLIGGGHSKLQPVFVEDVAQAVLVILKNKDLSGRIYELGGPTIMTFKEVLTYILNVTKRRALLIPIPYYLGKFMGAVLELFPHPLLTKDQVSLLACDNVVGENSYTFEHLGITPTSIHAVVPYYLKRYEKS